MEKVKVTRYMPGRRPDYAMESSSDSDHEVDDNDDNDNEEEVGVVRNREEELEEQRNEYNEREISKDKRLARLRERSTHIERLVTATIAICY